jgi:GTP-binding protein
MTTPAFILSAAQPLDFPPDEDAEIAVVGRSNSGKSTAINTIVGSRKLARVSKTPGRTQLINFFAIGPGRRLVDLPGYGFARVPVAMRARWKLLIEAYFSQRESLQGLVITVDVRRGLTELDTQMIDWTARLHVPVLVLLTKSDKLSRGAGKAQQLAVSRALEGAPTLLFSALTKQGVDAARQTLDQWWGGDG